MPTNLAKTARENLGLPSLHPLQREAADAVIAGRDALVVAPTGFGKSAIYELIGLARPGPTIVISPLLALQADQVQGLIERGLGAVAVNSKAAQRARESAFASIADGSVEFLFLAPEQLARAEVRERLAAAAPSLVVVDEAHCVSSWGHDFRPDYSLIGPFVEHLGRPPVVALTATASQPTREEIVTKLAMRDPLMLVAGLDRPNIYLDVRAVVDAGDKASIVADLVGASSPALVYVARRRTSEQLAAALDDHGIDAAAYHAGLPSSVRNAVQDRFMEGDLPVVVATTAFGMGIDKPDVRLVVHYDAPASLDAYYQEVGRAGRNGDAAAAVLLYRDADLGVQRYFASGGRLGADLLERIATAAGEGGRAVDRAALRTRVGVGDRRLTAALGRLADVGAVELVDGGRSVRSTTSDPARLADAAAEAEDIHERLERSRVEMVRGFAETRDCRRRVLLAYFGEELTDPCGHCDTCTNGTPAPTEQAGSKPWPADSRVHHNEWGGGTVVRYEDGVVTVRFDEHGFKTLSVETVQDRGLLEPAASAE